MLGVITFGLVDKERPRETVITRHEDLSQRYEELCFTEPTDAELIAIDRPIGQAPI